MINPPKELGIFGWKRLLLTIAVLLFLNGIVKWFSTPQEEDPQLPPRDGIVTVIYPGAPPADVERLVAKPIEDELAQVEEVREIKTRMRTDLLFMQIKLKDSVTHERTEEAWNKVQRALDRAAVKLPETAGRPDLNRDIYDQDAVFLALYGGSDRLVLFDQARALKDRLQLSPMVKAIDQVCPPGEQLTVLLDREKGARLGISIENFVKQLRGGNAAIPSGYVFLNGEKVTVLTNSFYRSAEELSKFPIVLRSGETVLLSDIAKISRTPTFPVRESMNFNGAAATGIGVVPQKYLNLTKFGEEVRRIVEEYEQTDSFKKSGLKIEEVSFQPHYVEERVRDIGLDLLKAIVLVGGVLMLMLGVRVGSIVAIQVPFVSAVAFGLFAMTGGIVNQISIAAFILAIGLLVDNVVVIVDGIQTKLDAGLGAVEAGETTRKEYLIPLLAGTLTTIAAFLPMLISHGISADFTRSIGVVATLALGCSYLFCIFVTPILAAALLRKGKARQWTFVEPLGKRMGELVQRRSKLLALAALGAVVCAFLGFRFVKQQFFPYADRDMVIVDIQLPEGTHYESTRRAASLVEAALLRDPRVKSVTTLLGRGVPPFYYNLPREPNAPHIAQMIVRTTSVKAARYLKLDREEELKRLVPFGVLIVKEISQGPPVKAPIEVRVFSDDPVKLQEAAQKAFALVREAKGVASVRSTLGVGALSYKVDVNDSAAGLYGVTRADVAAIVLAKTSGVPIATFRGGSDPYMIDLIYDTNEKSSFSEIGKSYLGSTRTDDVSVRTVVQNSVQYGPAVLEHYDRSPVVYIYAQLAPGCLENVADDNVKKQLAKLQPMPGVRYELAGAMKESADSQKKIFAALPVALFILLLSLMYEFNSYRRIAIILLTIPLCMIGSVPGLIVTGSTFGFMTLLGIFALAGTVIHNGIFLIDYIDHRRHEGIPLDEAITEGIQRRTRPIILTAVATIVELIPMTMSSSTLWPPFAWVIITGLTVSTLMTLLVIPSVFKLTFAREAEHAHAK